jgi:aminopeptidase-like protein
MNSNIGKKIYGLCETLWPITRSITGDGVRETLSIIKNILPDLKIHEVATGTECFDWTIPKEWNIKDAYVIDPDGQKIIDFKQNNLHLVSYSVPVNATMSLAELQNHLYSLPNQPDAIPYITSYYEERWGFCLTDSQRKQLKDGEYKVCIDSELKNGSLTYGEVLIPGKSTKEIFISTYICHPSMANNELSGPTVTTYLTKWLKSLEDNYYSYRVVFIPETIGSIYYISKNLDHMKEYIHAGFNISCVGDNYAYSYLPSRNEETLSDRVALHVLKHTHPDFVRYSYLDRGSDERQYCSPGVDLPIASIMRTKYAQYKEYHTSLDNLDFISPEGLFGSYEVLTKCIKSIESNKVYLSTILCEPQMGKRNLRPTLGGSTHNNLDVKLMSDILVYADGDHDLLSMANKFNKPIWDLLGSVQILLEKGLLTESK